MDKNKRKNIRNGIIQVGIIAFIIIGYFSIDFNSIYQSFKGEAQFITQDPSCDLHKGSCKIEIQDGTIFELNISPNTIPLMKPLIFTVKSNKENLKDLSLNIYATNMFMGDFILDLKNLGDGIYEASGTLPTCPIGNMKWNAEIRVKKINKTIGARFQFKTDI